MRLRILLAGSFQHAIYEEAWARAFTVLGHEVIRFAWADRFPGFLGRVQNRLLAGPALFRLNRDLHALALRENPDAVVVYRGTHVFARTLRKLRHALPGTVFCAYNNDDPFSANAGPLLFRHFISSVGENDLNLVYREKNARELRDRGARGVHVVLPAYLPWRDLPPAADSQAKYRCDVLFAGHYEADGRANFLCALKRQVPQLRVCGPQWQRAPSAVRELLNPEPALAGADYVQQLGSARIALSLLSGLNSDRYTRRCFEIPAVGSLLLCQRSSEMESLFLPGLEADYFSTPAELCAQVRRYLDDEPLRARVARAGHEKVRSAGHDMVSRVGEVATLLASALAEKRR